MGKNIYDDSDSEEVYDDKKDDREQVDDEVDYCKINDNITEIIEEFEYVEPTLNVVGPSDILYPYLVSYRYGYILDEDSKYNIREMTDIIFNMIEYNIKDKIDVDDVFYNLTRELMYSRIINRIYSMYA